MIKKELFSENFRQLSDSAKVLSHPARLAILKYLSECKTCISGDISDIIPLSRTTVSQHLNELKKAGLIKGEIDGLRIHYCIDHDKLNEMISKMNSFFTILNSNKVHC